jgi:hypothetical protein
MTRPKHHAVTSASDDRFETTDTELSEAVDRVYRKYGNDLSAFYRDVKKSIEIEKREDEKPKSWGASD